MDIEKRTRKVGEIVAGDDVRRNRVGERIKRAAFVKSVERVPEPERSDTAAFRIHRKISFRSYVQSSRRFEKARVGRVGGFDVRIGQVRLAVLAAHGADRLYELSFGKFFCEVRLVEPHDLDRARADGDDRFADGNLAFPRTARVELADGAEDSGAFSGDESRDGGLATGLVVAHGEVVQKVSDRRDTEPLQRRYLDGRQAEMLCERVVRSHGP